MKESADFGRICRNAKNQESMMNLRVTWICVMVALIGCGGSMAAAQDDIEVQGLGIRRGFELIFVPDLAAAAPEVSPADEILPEDAQAVVDAHNKEAHEIRRKAEQEIAARRDKTIKALQLLQDKYTREAKLDEAVAIRDRIRKLRVAHLKPMPNPGNLQPYTSKIDRTFYFDVMGSLNGPVWGTEVYTADSSLAAAAVHAGVLKSGQRGVVSVTIIRSPNVHTGSVANGVRSGDWGAFSASFTVESPDPTAVNVNESPTEK